MLRRLPAILVLAVAMIVVPARQAWALEGFMRWLERLSGPGGFTVSGLSIPIACWDTAAKKVTPLACPRKDNLTTEQRGFPLELGFEFSRGSGAGDLTYATSLTPLTDDRKKVRVLTLGGTFEVPIRKAIDVGAGLHMTRYSGDLFSSFSRLTVDAVRVTVRPFQLTRHDTRPWQEVFEVRFTTSWNGQFTAEDFGAVPGTYKSGREFQSGISIGLDFGKMIRTRLLGS